MSGHPCGCDGAHMCDRHHIEALEARVAWLEATPSTAVADDIMAEAVSLTNGDRRAAYGDAREVFAAYGHAWSAILAPKLQPGVFIDAADATLMMAVLKICREAHKVKRDNVVDAHGYLRLHARVTGLNESTRETTDGNIIKTWSCGCQTSPDDLSWVRDCGKGDECARCKCGDKQDGRGHPSACPARSGVEHG